MHKMEDPAIQKAYEVLDSLSSDPETIRLAELRMKQILDERSMVEGAREEGKIEGKEEDVIGLLRLGVSEEIIAQGTGLSIEKVKELRSRT